ncbi:MAG: hypothetical protein HQM06_16445 [Magnetococcales bacterium]|nr:hypothetical protein [Magnetococcales bacterium]
MESRHAQVRLQQRGIPPLISDWLDCYGREEHDGHGAIILFFDKKSIRYLEQNIGSRTVDKVLANSSWRYVYKVVSTGDGCTITIGHRDSRIWRR